MALSDLIARLERDAQARLDDVARRTREEIEQIEAQAGRASAQRRDAELAARRTRRQAALDRELAAARAKARGEVLRARQTLIDRIFERARALLPTRATAPEVREAIAGRVSRSLSYLGGAARGRCSAELTGALTRPGVAWEADAKVPAGALLEALDGSVTIDLTLERALESGRAELAIGLAKELPP